jgi:predicted membrane chloride channel (bestrophin family)
MLRFKLRALIAWALRLVADERDAGRCDGSDAWLVISNLLQLRGKLATNYDLVGRPVPFVYVHLVRVLTEIFVPLFAFALTQISHGTITDHVLAVAAIVVTNFFFLAINITTKKLADPYGHDLDDLHILSLCELMPGACARILETSAPSRRAESAETTT